MIDMNSSISVITYNVNDVNAPMKKQKLSEWIKNTTQLYVVYKKPTLNMKTYINKNMNEWRKIYHANTDQKKVEVAILISEGADFKVRRIIRNKGHYIMIKCQVFKKINNSYCACVCQTIEHQTI